jgi:hypothetical protein
MPTFLVGSTASIGYREITEEDDVALDCEELVGGLLISSLRSSATGGASHLLRKFIAAHPDRNMALVAFAESGDHARLMRLYSRFDFYVADGRNVEDCPFGALMFRCP